MVFFQVKIFLLLVWFVRVSGKIGTYSVPVALEAQLNPYLISMQHLPVCYQERQLLVMMCRIQNHRHRPETVSKTHSLSPVWGTPELGNSLFLLSILLLRKWHGWDGSPAAEALIQTRWSALWAALCPESWTEGDSDHLLLDMFTWITAASSHFLGRTG